MGQSTEDLFQQQIQKGEYCDNGGHGAKPPLGGGDGSGSGILGGSKDGCFAGMLDETFQVVLATIGFMFLVLCLSLFLSVFVCMLHELGIDKCFNIIYWSYSFFIVCD